MNLASKQRSYNGSCHMHMGRGSVRQDRLREQSSIAGDVESLRYPDDMDDELLLIPTDVSVEKVGAFGTVKAMVNAANIADFFEMHRNKKFCAEHLPLPKLPMTVGKWVNSD
eukprot:s4572_g1.t1